MTADPATNRQQMIKARLAVNRERASNQGKRVGDTGIEPVTSSV
jgi:hypothetical protein